MFYHSRDDPAEALEQTTDAPDTLNDVDNLPNEQETSEALTVPDPATPEKGKPSRSAVKKRNRRKRKRNPGLLPLLNHACTATFRLIAASRLVKLVYDNLNIMSRVAEQILGRKSKFFAVPD